MIIKIVHQLTDYFNCLSFSIPAKSGLDPKAKSDDIKLSFTRTEALQSGLFSLPGGRDKCRKAIQRRRKLSN